MAHTLKNTMWCCARRFGRKVNCYRTKGKDTAHGPTTELDYKSRWYLHSGALSDSELKELAGSGHLRDLDLTRCNGTDPRRLFDALLRCSELERVCLPEGIGKDEAAEFRSDFSKRHSRPAPCVLPFFNSAEIWESLWEWRTAISPSKPYGEIWRFGTNWSYPNNANVADTFSALAADHETKLIYAHNFNFGIPASTITGVKVEALCKKASGDGDLYTTDLSLTKTKLDWSENKADVINPWTTSYTDRGAGGQTDTWNFGLAYGDVNDSKFGVFFRVENSSDDDATPNVEYIWVTVWYTVSGVPYYVTEYPRTTENYDLT